MALTLPLGTEVVRALRESQNRSGSRKEHHVHRPDPRPARRERRLARPHRRQLVLRCHRRRSRPPLLGEGPHLHRRAPGELPAVPGRGAQQPVPLLTHLAGLRFGTTSRRPEPEPHSSYPVLTSSLTPSGTGLFLLKTLDAFDNCLARVEHASLAINE